MSLSCFSIHFLFLSFFCEYILAFFFYLYFLRYTMTLMFCLSNWYLLSYILQSYSPVLFTCFIRIKIHVEMSRNFIFFVDNYYDNRQFCLTFWKRSLKHYFNNMQCWCGLGYCFHWSYIFSYTFIGRSYLLSSNIWKYIHFKCFSNWTNLNPWTVNKKFCQTLNKINKINRWSTKNQCTKQRKKAKLFKRRVLQVSQNTNSNW